MPPPGGIRTNLAFATSGPMSSYSSVTFGPGTPLQPSTQQPIRFVDYPVSVNTNIRPRASAPIGFPELRAFSNVELVRMAIETRKDQLERLEWQIVPVDAKGTKAKGGADAAVAKVTKFWRKPDGITHFATWQRLLMEDMLVLDAPTVARLRTRGGGFLGLEVIPGDTIHPMVDETGRRPRQPGDVAYQQVIKGTVWNNLTNDEIIYTPRNPRPNHLYGFSPVEQIIVTINTIIRRQAAQLAWFTAGNQPAGLLNAPATWNPDQIKDMQAWLDAKVSGNQAEQSKLLVVPEMKYQAFKDAPLKDDFDEWLARIVAYSFSLPPTPFIKQMNRSTGQTDADRAMEEGLEPLKLWFKRFADSVIQEDLGEPGLEWAWMNTPEIDPKAQSEIDDTNLRNGSTTLDEVRDARGADPLPDGQGAKPMVYTSTGAVTLEQVLQAAEDAMAPPEPEQPQAVLPPVQPGAAPVPKPGTKAPKPKPVAAGAEKVAKAASNLISTDRPLARRAEASLRKTVAPILARAGDEAAASVAKALRQLGKAADDGSVAATLAAAADLEAFDELVDAIFDDLFEVVADAASLAIASVGATSSDALVDQVNERAVAYAKARAAELVSLQGDRSIVEATRAQIQEAIVSGLANNTGAAAIADAIQALPAFSAERAELIADAEIRMANAAGKTAGWDEARTEQGLELQKGWQTSNSDDCCDDCSDNEAAGLIPFDEDFPSGATDEGDSHPNCFVGSTRVEGAFVAGSKAFYEGKVREIITRSGAHLTVTPNHPIFTARGKLPAAMVKVGDHAISYRPVVVSSCSAAVADDDHRPAPIEQVVHAVGLAGARGRMEAALDDFHGDAIAFKGDVEIVVTDSKLLGDVEPASTELLSQERLVSADQPSTDLVGSGSLSENFGPFKRTAARSVSGSHQPAALLVGRLGHAETQRLRASAALDAGLLETIAQNNPVDADLAGERLFGLTGDVSLDEVVEVRDVDFSGHVFDLQTHTGWMVAESLVVSNCHCVTYVEVIEPDAAGE